ncbi:MAG: UDP-N-acetylenolpyruvoylglucosamine reductase 2 [Nitrospinaceae bacterium]|nr:MAG: UDP-N-acetylenolpyruvoylglucosamine reductase 2 [Nitrospinaceae bacterium]
MTNPFPWLTKIKGEVRRDELLMAHTSIRIGGPADFFVLPEDISDLQTIFKYHGETPVCALGEGTNLLVPDNGIRGIVISLKDSFRSIHPPVFAQSADKKDKATLRVGAGVKLSYLAKYAAKYSLSGIERLVGIPGSLGGAVIMNAGAEGTEIGPFIKSVTRVTTSGEVEVLKGDEIDFMYRKTIFPSEGGIIVEVELELEKGDMKSIHETMNSHLFRRSSKQPLTVPNSGSIFKNPPGDSAGRLIEAAGLKGVSVGQAGVSLKHANFIVNKGNASAADVRNLISHIQEVVEEKSGVKLEPEIVILGG